MKIVPQSQFKWIEAHSRLVRKHLAEHRAELHDLRGVKRWLAWLKLVRKAWKYANRETRKADHDPRKLYSSR